MTTFQYWIPEGGMTIRPELVANLGLSYALPDQVTARTCTRGPDGRSGAVAVAGDNADGRAGYYADRQTWRKAGDRGVWCGIYTDDPPTPADLARSDQVSGVRVADDTGEIWLCPIARRWVEVGDDLLWDQNLPRRLELTEEGTWAPGDVKPRYRRLWRLATDYEAAVQEALEGEPDASGMVRFNYDSIDDLAIGALAINYRVGPYELDLLGIYDDQFRQAIIDALLDAATWKNWHEKKTAETARDGGNS